MIGLGLGFLAFGLVAGFLLARARFQMKASPEQQEALESMAAEVEKIKKQLSQLQQDKADLSYQLGESKKTLNHTEQCMKKLQGQLEDN